MNIASIAGGIFNVIFFILVLVLLAGMIGALFWFVMRTLKYKFTCIIFKNDAFGNTSEKHDKAGIFVDRKTGNKLFFLKRANVGLKPDKVPVVNVGKKKIVYLFQDGLKNFRYLRMNFASNPGFSTSVDEEDVNWAINSFQRAKQIFTANKLLQYMPYIALFFTGIIIMAIFFFFFKEFSTLKDVSVALREAAVAMKEANSGTTIIPV